MKLTRSYVLKIYPNYHKLEDLRYSASRYHIFLQHFVTQLYYHPWVRFYSTEGMGTLAHHAQKQARGIIDGEFAAAKEQNRKSNCPQAKVDSCPAIIAKAEQTRFDYWITLNSQWKNRVKIPAKSFGRVNKKLRSGWILSGYCEFFRAKNSQWLVRVFMTKGMSKPVAKDQCLGIDAGLAHGVTRSDNYLGRNLSKIIRCERTKQAERQKQGHLKRPFKTVVKQQLDREVNWALARCHSNSWNLAIESPKVLANLKLNRWARSYFANRAGMRAAEEGVYVQWVNPAYTSVTCSKCGHIDKQSRVNQSSFCCTGCGNTLNADINAAINIARKGQERILIRESAEAPVNTVLTRGV